jgi:hypothetical protein
MNTLFYLGKTLQPEGEKPSKYISYIFRISVEIALSNQALERANLIQCISRK